MTGPVLTETSNTRVIPATILLAGKGQAYNEVLAQMATHTDIVTSAFDNMRNTVGQQAKMFEIRLQNIGIVIGLYLLPYLSLFLKGLMGIAGAMLGWIQVPAHFTLVATAVKGLAIILSAMLLPAVVHLVIAALPFLAILGALVVASIAVGKAFEFVTSHWQQFVSFLGSNTWQAIALKSVLIAIGVVLLSLATEAIVAAIGGFITMIPWILLSTAMMWGLASAVIGATWPFVLAIVAIAAFVFALIMLVTHWKQVWGAIENVVRTVVHFVTSLVRRFVDGLVAMFLWLYQHNTYFKALVDFIINVFTVCKTFLTTLWNNITGWLAGVWNGIVIRAKAAWQLVYSNIIAPIQRLWSGIQAVFGTLWTNISNWFGDLANKALTWGKNFISMLIQGIKGEVGHLWDQITGIGDGIRKFLGFHSPPAAGPLSDSHQYMPNMMRMFTQGITAGMPAMALAARNAAAVLAMSLSGVSAARATSSARTASLVGSGLAGGGSGDTHIHAVFPNVTSANELRKAFDDLATARERTAYAKGRQAGYGRGLRAGV